jgi:hypothetical protein
MNRRAREVLTSIAAAGIGGAIGTLVGRGRSTRRSRRARPSAAPDAELDAMDTVPTYDDVEIVIVEGQILPDDEILEIAILDPVDADEVAFDARPERADDGFVASRREDPPRADEGTAGDDRGDGENWIEDMLEDTSNDLPAERPLAIQADMDQKLTSLDDTRPRRR